MRRPPDFSESQGDAFAKLSEADQQQGQEERVQDHLTPQEAQAVLDLYHLQQKQREEDAGYVRLDELRDVLGVSEEQLAALVVSVRNVLPTRLATSADKVSQREAELIVARNARQATTLPGQVPPDRQLLERVRSRTLELAELDRRSHPAGPRLDFQIASGEHPRSWEIMWIVLGVVVLLLIVFLVFGRHV